MNDNSLRSVVLRRPNVVVRLLGSIRFGITMLVLILVYASVGSALAPVRGALELTEMQVFQHWLFVLLLALFTASLITATVTRIRWNVVNAGVLTVHTGLLLLVGGAAWYFSTKVEGDVLLVSPRVELLNGSGQKLKSAEFLAEPGQSWEQFMPAFGGAVRLEVVSTGPQGDDPVGRAVVRATFGQNVPQTVQLTANAGPTPLGNGLALRLRTFAAQSKFYVHDVPALYYGKSGEGTPHCVEMAGLPLHRERYLPGDGGLRDTEGRVVESKRTRPQLAIGSWRIGTGWLEPWRLPIRLHTPELPFEVEVTGYVPYIAGLGNSVAGDGDTENPMIAFRLASGSESIEQALAALDPLRSVLDLQTPIELRWVSSAADLDAALAPQVGPAELTIEMLSPPVKKVVGITAQQTLPIEGTAYELTVQSLTPSWPLATPGFEGAHSPVAMVNVKSPDKTYQRTVVERFPQLSQDIDEHGVRHTEGPYDSNLILRYRSCQQGRVLIVGGPGLPLTLGVFAPDGSVQRFPLAVGQEQPIRLGSLAASLTLLTYQPFGRWLVQPVIEPVALRRPNLGRGPSAVRLKLTGRGALAGWRDSQWCLFSSFPIADDAAGPESLAATPLTVQTPDGNQWELIYSESAHDLGALLAPGKLSVKLFPGGHSPESWRSDFYVKTGARAEFRPALVQTNQTYTVGRWTLFQSGAANDHWNWTILGVGNRHGIWPMAAGCVMIVLGCLYAFYVKPVLKRRGAVAGAVPSVGAQPRGRGARSEKAQPVMVDVEQ